MGYRDDYFNANKSNRGWYTCARCGRKLRREDADIDHIFPQKHGGGDGLDNLQCLCRHCNRSKRDSLRHVPSDYLANNVRRATDWTKNFLGH